MLRKIKEIAGNRSIPTSKCIKAADGCVLNEPEEVAARWEEYVQDLYETVPETAETGP